MRIFGSRYRDVNKMKFAGVNLWHNFFIFIFEYTGDNKFGKIYTENLEKVLLYWDMVIKIVLSGNRNRWLTNYFKSSDKPGNLEKAQVGLILHVGVD